MAFWDWLTFRKKRIDYDIEQIVRASARSFTKPIRQRETYDSWQKNSFWIYDGVISRDEFRSKAVLDNLRLIRDINPSASQAIWNFLRLANNGHEVEVVNSSGKVDKRGTELINDVAKRVGKLYGGGTDQLITVLLLTAYTQGALALEVELSENLKDVEDFHAVDPSTLDFRRDPDTGSVQLVQQQQDGQYKILNQETVFYHGIDPDIQTPQGRSPVLPVLQVVFFQVQVLKDLQKVVHHQGHRRFDIKVLESAIIENMPDHIKHQGPEAVTNYVQSYIQDIEAQMSQLEPDSDFFHTDSVEIEMTGGGVGSSGGLDVVRVMDIINQQIVSALKQMPILMGLNEGSTETHSTVQWQIYVAGIESVRRGIKRILERAYNVVLQIHGIQGRARIEFDPIRVTDRKADAEAEEIETRTKIAQYNQGWITNDEAAIEMVGHEAVDEPKTTVQVKANVNLDNPVPEEEVEETTSRKVTPLKKKDFTTRAEEDEYILLIDEDWAPEVARMTAEAEQEFLETLQEERDTYIKRLHQAPAVPTRVLVDVRFFKNFMKKIPSPPDSFKGWVKSNILTDSYKRANTWKNKLRNRMGKAIQTTGAATLLSLGLNKGFKKDDRVNRWLNERTTADSEYIQQLTDEEVIASLWAAVYEGQTKPTDLEKQLMETYAFSPQRAQTFARTEMVAAARSGQFHGDVQSGKVEKKIWKSVLQYNTRKGHEEAHEQVRELNEPFLVENAYGVYDQLMFPMDTSLNADISNIINCLCWYDKVLKEEAE